MSDILHPEIFETLAFGGHIKQALEQHAKDAATLTDQNDEVSILIRTRNNVRNLEQMFDEIGRQNFAGVVEVVLVDTESTDGTPKLAHKLGAEVVNITQEDFTYPLSLNKGMEAASHDNVFMTVGHANLSNRHTLGAVVKHARKAEVAGAYGSTIPNANASRTERLMAVTAAFSMGPARNIEKGTMGVLGATNAFVRKGVWAELGGYDLNYAAGGEDTEFARRMLANGMVIIKEPALSVHHSHGLGPINTARQFKHWAEVAKGSAEFDHAAIARRRPDLGLKN